MTTAAAQPAIAPGPVAIEEPRRKRRHKPNVRVAALNITSMMDLTFNLLLFFVLTANFSAGEGSLPADLPAGSGGGGPAASIAANEPKPPENPLIIALRAVGGSQVVIQVEGAGAAPQDFERLYEQLKGWQHNDQNPQGIYEAKNPIIIKPDKGVLWTHVVDTFNAVVRAKYTNVGFAPAQ